MPGAGNICPGEYDKGHLIMAQLDFYRELRGRLEAAPQGERGALVDEAAAFMRCSRDTVYRNLKKAGWTSGRKIRADKGETSVDENLARLAAGIVHTATRANGKKTLPLTTTLNILKENGEGVVDKDTGEVTMPHPATVARIMRRYGCHPTQLAKGTPPRELRTPHPNHTWQMDSSICILFYLGKHKVQVLDEKKYYKNKPEHLEKIKKKRVIRWVITDHYSGMVFVRYTLGDENSVTAISILVEAMCRRDDCPFHGVPFQLYTDKGSPFTSDLTRGFLERIGCKAIDHAAGNARATGQVENAQNIVETQFEGRLRMYDIDNLDDLNAEARKWQNSWNANFIHRRHKKSRNAVWLTITRQQLRTPQSREALLALVETEKICTVPNTLVLSFTPKGFERGDYSLSDIPGLVTKQKIKVRVNPFEDMDEGNRIAIDVVVTNARGEEAIYTIKPIKRDFAGFDLTAPVIGQEMKSHPNTVNARQHKKILQEAYGAVGLKEAEKAHKANKRAYAHINPMADVEAARKPLYFEKQGTPHGVTAPSRRSVPLSQVEAGKRLKRAMEEQGHIWNKEHMQFITTHFPKGITEEELPAALDSLLHLPGCKTGTMKTPAAATGTDGIMKVIGG